VLLLLSLSAAAMRDGTTGADVGKEKATGPRDRQTVPFADTASWLMRKARRYQPLLT
jgi:hypothetical protein